MIDQETINLANDVDITKVAMYFGYEEPEKIICPVHDDNNASCFFFFSKGKTHITVSVVVKISIV